jgi:hypothetical protein
VCFQSSPYHARNERQQAADSDDEPEAADDADAPVTKTGRNPKKGRWAISNYVSPPTAFQNKTKKPVWRWECKWCSYVLKFDANITLSTCQKLQDLQNLAPYTRLHQIRE